jgi:hypothetical protein
VITLSHPDAQMTQLLYATMMESIGEIDAKISIDSVSFDITLDASNRLARQEMTISVHAEFSAEQSATITSTTIWDYTEYGGERVVKVPADYDDYMPCTYDDFYESEYVADLLFMDDVNGDGVGEYLYIVNEPYHDPSQPVVDILIYDPAHAYFINTAEVMRTHFSVGGFYVYYDENDVPYLLHYNALRDADNSGAFSRFEASYVVYRIEPEKNGIHTYMDMLTQNSVQVYDTNADNWEEQYAQICKFTDELNALLDQSIMIADSSTGELWLGDGASTMEVDFSWLFAEFLYELDPGYKHDRRVLLVDSYALTVRSSPEVSAEGETSNVIGYLGEGDTVVRIATDAAWSLILYDGGLGYVSNNYVRELY